MDRIAHEWRKVVRQELFENGRMYGLVGIILIGFWFLHWFSGLVE